MNVTSLFLSIVMAVLPLAARASDNMAASTAANFLAYAFPLVPIEKGQLDAQLAPAYFTTHFKDNQGDPNTERNGDAKGLGGAASVTYGLVPHFGLGFSGIYFKSTSGSFTQGNGCAAPACGSGSMSEEGFIGAATAIFDPMSGENFRLPIIAGLNYQNLQNDFTPIFTRKTLDTPGVQVGVSAQFNTGAYLRWEPFLMVSHPFRREQCTGLDGSAGDCGTQTNYESDTGPVPGLNVLFKPLKLAFFWAPSVGPRAGTSVYALRLHRTFGGPAAASDSK